jgi:hypothetical protein
MGGHLRASVEMRAQRILRSSQFRKGLGLLILFQNGVKNGFVHVPGSFNVMCFSHRLGFVWAFGLSLNGKTRVLRGGRRQTELNDT